VTNDATATPNRPTAFSTKYYYYYYYYYYYCNRFTAPWTLSGTAG